MTVEAPVLRILEKIVGEVDEVLGNTPRVEDYVDSQWAVLEQEQPALARFLDRRLFHLVVYNDAGAEFLARPHEFFFKLGAVLVSDATKRAGLRVRIEESDLENVDDLVESSILDSSWFLAEREGASALITYLSALAGAMSKEKLRQDFREGAMFVLLLFWRKLKGEGVRPFLRVLK